MPGLGVYIDMACACTDHLSSRRHTTPRPSQFFLHVLSFHPVVSPCHTCSCARFGLTFGSVHTEDNQNKYMSNTNHAPPPMAQVATHHAGVTGVMWPIVDGDNDTSPAPSHATRTMPCRLPPALSCAAATTPTCHCCQCHPLVSPHDAHPCPSHTPNHLRPSHSKCHTSICAFSLN